MITGLDRVAAALAGRYRVERELGRGGMATVWLAEDVRHGRKVAIKVLHPHLAAVLGAERFLKEIRTTANLQHPHILPLFDSGEADGLLYYVMPYLTGETLRQAIARDKQLPIADAIRITSEVAAALEHAHRQGVIHRDIKPENILLHDGQAVVADFGIAIATAATEPRLTETGLSIGTPSYMSPEQALGERTLDARTDVYAMGAVLYEMLTGSPPFSGASAQAVVAKVVAEKPVPPSRHRKGIPARLNDAVLTALEKRPEDRFVSAAALAAAVTGAAPGPMSRRRRLRAVRAGLAVAGVIAVVLVAMHRGSGSATGVRRHHDPDTAAVRLVKLAQSREAKRNAENCDSALAEYSEATYNDSLYAEAWGGLARASALCTMFGAKDRRVAFAAAHTAAEAALKLDPDLPVALTAQGMVALFSRQDYLSAQKSFRAAIRFDSMGYEPWLYQAWSYVGRGLLDSAVWSMRRAYEIDPAPPIITARLSEVLLLQGDTAAALRQVNELLSREPTYALGYSQRLEVYNAMGPGHCADALRDIRSGEPWAAHFRKEDVVYALATCGMRDSAVTLADSLGSTWHMGFGMAVVFAGLGDSVRTFVALDSAIAHPGSTFFFLPYHYAFVRYHGTKAFDDVLARAHVKR